MMNLPEILVSGNIPVSVLDMLRQKCRVTWHDIDRPMPRSEFLKQAAGKDGILSMITDRIDEDVFQTAPQLRIVANMGVGYNNIDVAQATSHSVLVTNTPGVLTDATADLAFALILAVSRRIVEGDRMVREGRFQFWAPFLFLGSDLSSKTIGIIGMGRIGRAVAKRALGFNMRILYHNRERLSLDEEASLKAQSTDMNTLLETSDFVSLHVPLTEKTKHLIGAEAFRTMKPTAYLINTARGAVVDEKALLEALTEKRIAGAGLDVYEQEPALTPGLTDLDQVVLLPHVGSATLETRTKMATMAAENLLAGLHGEKPPNLVNPEVFQRRSSS
ncbi:MAG: glyoxylate reductase [Syntrophus sp. SKADARSKE-3]|nr:glyoxylate reductase [Syntrophus sp. SKADARSKE-3]